MVRLVHRTPESRPLVLLIEDDADTRDMYHMGLEFDGFRVVDLGSGSNALDRAVELKPDVVVTDITLRGVIDGIALAHRLKADARTAEVPVVAVTGGDPNALDANPGLFDQVLLKPVLPEDLSVRLRAVVAQSKALWARSERARQRVPELLSRVQCAHERSSLAFEERARRALRQECPVCGGWLVWHERRKVAGAAIDFFDPCAQGCGEFVYDRRACRMLPA